MSAAEVARMKATLRFLREHRNTLKLKVNAAEDLLLNGKREPTHRGLCQHLLSKLDRARVLQAAERMPPAQATEFLAGIVRFAPEVPYLLEFLRSVKTSAHPRQAAAALTQALERVDFAETSGAQMRDLLQLVVDVFPASELPVFVFSLLSGAAFRSAFDRSSEGLPSSLAELLLPLRSLHRALARRGGSQRREPQSRQLQGEARLSLEQVREGALLMLGASRDNLLELSEAQRRQLLEAGADALGRVAVRAPNQVLAESLLGLFSSLELRDPVARAALVRELASGLLRAGIEARASELLRAEQSALPDPRWAQHWLAALSGTRVADLALEQRPRREPRRRRGGERGRAGAAGARREGTPEGAIERAPEDTGSGDALGGDRWQRGFHLPTQREVLVRFDDAAAPGALRAHAELRRRALFPGVASVVAEEFDDAAQARLALAWHGPPLPRRLPAGRHDARLAPELALAWCREACRMLAALAAGGLELPDAALHRFSADLDDRLWLVDLWLVRETAPAAAQVTQLGLARRLCRELLGALDQDVLPAAAARALESAHGFDELLAALNPL